MVLVEHSFRAMGGPCRLRVECDDAARAQAALQRAEAEVLRLESKYSRYRADSVTSAINGAAGGRRAVPVDTETAGLLDFADTLWRESGGLFDSTSGVLRRAWDFHSGQPPRQERLQHYLPLVGWQRVQRDGSCVRLPLRGMELDLGGCVKEYACDAAAAELSRAGIAHALVDLCGDMAVTGPRADGSPWRIGIRHPECRDVALAGVALADGGLASSGDYERCIEIGGRRYGHILNPVTGWPVEGLAAVSVLAQQCLVAGGAATVAMLKPEREALQWLGALGIPWLAVDRDMGCHGSIAAG